MANRSVRPLGLVFLVLGLLNVKDEFLQHGGERKGNYLLVRAIKRVMRNCQQRTRESSSGLIINGAGTGR
jgi:hypothetical protein